MRYDFVAEKGGQSRARKAATPVIVGKADQDADKRVPLVSMPDQLHSTR